MQLKMQMPLSSKAKQDQLKNQDVKSAPNRRQAS